MQLVPLHKGTGCCGNQVNGAVGFWTHASPNTSNCANTFSSKTGLQINKWQHIAVVVGAPVHVDFP
jgi:hypothetical protein